MNRRGFIGTLMGLLPSLSLLRQYRKKPEPRIPSVQSNLNWGTAGNGYGWLEWEPFTWELHNQIKAGGAIIEWRKFKGIPDGPKVIMCGKGSHIRNCEFRQIGVLINPAITGSISHCNFVGGCGVTTYLIASDQFEFSHNDFARASYRMT